MRIRDWSSDVCSSDLPQEEGAEIAVEARVIGDRLVLKVSDTGPGLNDAAPRPTSSTGVGLANTRDRLAQAYGPDHRFALKTNPSGRSEERRVGKECVSTC